MEFKSVFVLAGIFMLSAVTVDALRCYDCNNIRDGPCFDPEERNASISKCSDTILTTDAVCYKVLGPFGDDEQVIRGCLSSLAIEGFCKTTTQVNGVDCVYCTEDLCNSSNSISIVGITFLILSFIVAKML